MSNSDRYASFIAYIPILGWIYVMLFQNTRPLPMFHLRQSIGLFVFLVGVFLGWVLVAWITVWVPFGFTFGVALFTLVITAFVFVVVAWIMGMLNALRGRMTLLPIVGYTANRMLL